MASWNTADPYSNNNYGAMQQQQPQQLMTSNNNANAYGQGDGQQGQQGQDYPEEDDADVPDQDADMDKLVPIVPNLKDLPNHERMFYRHIPKNSKDQIPENNFGSKEVLPIDLRKREIVKHFLKHRITCIRGETGCGKSTRIPIFLKEMWDAGLIKNPSLLLDSDNPFLNEGKDARNVNANSKEDGKKKTESGEEHTHFRVLVTQPRRIACISLAQRVADSVSSRLGDSVGYMISGDNNTKKGRTQIIFVTTGYLLQMVVNNPERLNEYSHIVLDEVHERDVDADLVNLIIKLQMRQAAKSFRLVIMSATLQGDLFGKYFCEGNKKVKPIYVGAKRYQRIFSQQDRKSAQV